jgi:NFU1 iron-sulfur cluster scaffold homolog, mitochondrial
VQVNPLPPGATVEAVDSALNALRGAVSSYGGSVEVLSVADGVCELRYVGPAPIGKGLIGAVKDQFPDIKEVKLL